MITPVVIIAYCTPTPTVLLTAWASNMPGRICNTYIIFAGITIYYRSNTILTTFHNTHPLNLRLLYMGFNLEIKLLANLIAAGFSSMEKDLYTHTFNDNNCISFQKLQLPANLDGVIL